MELASQEILIVDDEAPLLRLMSMFLARTGYGAVTANTIEKAWEHLKAHPGQTTVVVLDAGMAATGVDDPVLEMLAFDAKLRVMVSSGYPVDMRALRQAAPDRVEFLHKPFSPDMLLEALRRMLGPEEKEV